MYSTLYIVRDSTKVTSQRATIDDWIGQTCTRMSQSHMLKMSRVLYVQKSTDFFYTALLATFCLRSYRAYISVVGDLGAIAIRFDSPTKKALKTAAFIYKF